MSVTGKRGAEGVWPKVLSASAVQSVNTVIRYPTYQTPNGLGVVDCSPSNDGSGSLSVTVGRPLRPAGGMGFLTSQGR